MESSYVILFLMNRGDVIACSFQFYLLQSENPIRNSKCRYSHQSINSFTFKVHNKNE